MTQKRVSATRNALVVGLLALTLVGITVGVTRASHNCSDVPDTIFYHDFVDLDGRHRPHARLVRVDARRSTITEQPARTTETAA